MMAVTVKGLNEVIAKITKFFKDDVVTRGVLDEAGKLVTERIRATTRSGKSLKDGKKLKRLSESYKEMRRGAVKFRTINGQKVPFAEPDERLNEVDTQFFDPDFSNLTFTGQMLRALKYVINVSERTVTVTVDENKRSGKYEKLTNAQVAKHVADNGRPFLGLDKTGVARVTALIKASIRKNLIKRGLKK
jgi:hypothetical protein